MAMERSKQRLKILAIILSIVAVLHLVVIFFIYSSPKGRAIEAESELLVAEDVAKKEKKPVVEMTPLRFRKASTNPNFGKPFDMSNAVKGNLPQLPQSKESRSGFLVDLDTRKVLWAKNEEQSVPIASMTKMMTLLITFETLDVTPKWSLQTPVKISEASTKVAESGIIWLDTRETFSLHKLLQAATIKSANDAAYQVAEFIGNGDVDRFISRMNAKAAQLNMTKTKFINPHGLPDRKLGNSVGSAKDMVILGERLLEYPDIMEMTKTPLAYMSSPIRHPKTQLYHTNHLIHSRCPGVDGLKTGFTNAAGFCSTVSCIREGKRLMVCVTGFEKAKNGRDLFLSKLLDWGFERAKELENKN